MAPHYELSRWWGTPAVGNGGHSGGGHEVLPVLNIGETPRSDRLSGSGAAYGEWRPWDCVERNRSERSKVANVCGVEAPASPEAYTKAILKIAVDTSCRRRVRFLPVNVSVVETWPG